MPFMDGPLSKLKLEEFSNSILVRNTYKSRLETLPLTESLASQRHLKNAKRYYAVKVDMIKIPMNAQFFYEFKLTINLPPVRFIISVVL